MSGPVEWMAFGRPSIQRMRQERRANGGMHATKDFGDLDLTFKLRKLSNRKQGYQKREAMITRPQHFQSYKDHDLNDFAVSLTDNEHHRLKRKHDMLSGQSK